MLKKIAILFILIISLGRICLGQFAEVPAPDRNEQSKVDLTGKWLFNPHFIDNNKKKVASNWQEIEVPGEWIMQGFKVKPGRQAGYSRAFDIPASWKNRTVYLRCDAVFSQATIWVNQKNAGRHVGPMTAFETDITSLVKFDKTNQITLGIVAETMADTLMSGTQYAAHQLGGIMRKVYLYAVPKVHFANLAVETDLDNNYRHALLKIKASLVNNAKPGKVSVLTRLFTTEGTVVELQNSKKEFYLGNNKSTNIQLNFSVANPLKWDAEHPNLYHLEFEIVSDAGTQVIKKNIGFREIEVVGNQLFVNGRPVKLKGVNRHEVHPLLGRSLTNEWWKKDAELFKAANVNYIRTSHYPPSEEFIEWCDKIGLFVELENPICWVGHHANHHWKTANPKDSELYSYFKDISKATIGFFRNHPSIIIWSMANESMWTENWSKLADFYAEQDFTRPATFHDQAYGGFNNYGSKKMPVANIHYPGIPGPEVAENFERPLLFGEYAHLNTYNRVEIVTDPGVRDAWGRGFKPMWENMYKSRGCLGGAIWSGIDDVFYLPDGRAVGYGEWGPIDGWRREKPEYYHMKKTYSPVKFHNQKVKAPLGNGKIRLQVENRFDFTDLNECKIFWDVDGKVGEVKMELAPHHSGILDINTGLTDLDGKIMTVRVVSPYGLEVEACAIEIGNVKRNDFPFEGINCSDISATETGDLLDIKGKNFSWIFNIKEGVLSKTIVNGETVLNCGAELMMLDLQSGPCNTEHSLEIPLHNSLCSGKLVEHISWKQSRDTVIVSVGVVYDQAKGEMIYKFTDNGKLLTEYNFISKVDMKPRQWGIVFTGPSENNHLQWYRKGLWSWYPENHIGRTNGKAIPFGKKAFQIESFGQIPENEWRYDANHLGTNDFRATRENIYWAALTNNSGIGITVLSDGSQAFRAYVDKENINFLVADFSTGGGDIFFATHYKDERKNLLEGSEIKGSVQIQLIKGKLQTKEN